MTTTRCATGMAGHRVTLRAGAAVLAALFVNASQARAQFAGDPSLANLSTTGVQADRDAWAVSVSANGRVIAFASDATNLVALDTNNATDVFVRDNATKITERVSVNWQGQEAHGDSTCPAVSADGRYVAFRSRAWNMVQGADNLGTPMWDVYLHDRQGPSTIRVSTPLGGGKAVGDSG